MVIGIMELQLALFDNDSLKAKRSVVKRVLHRCRHTFNVSAAEVEDQDLTDRATLAVVAVGNDRRFIASTLDKVEDFVIRLGIAELLDAPKIIETY